MLKRVMIVVAVGLLLSRALDQKVAAAPAREPGQSAAVERETAGAVREAGDAHGAGGDHARPSLIPDPTQRETWMQALWVVIIFLVLLIILWRTAWKNVLAGLKAREQRIRKDIADAEAARARAEATLREYQAQLANAENQVREMLTKAAADGERIATNLRMQAQQDSEEIKERATRDIDAAKNQATSEIYQQAAVLATSVAEKILRRNLNPEDQRELVNRSLEQLQTIGRT